MIQSKSLSYFLLFSWLIFAGINLYPTPESIIENSKKEYHERIVDLDDIGESYEQIYGYFDKWTYAQWYRAWIVLIIGISLSLCYIRYKAVTFYYLSCLLGGVYCLYIAELYSTIYLFKGLLNYGFVGFYDHLSIMLKNKFPNPVNDPLSILFFLCFVKQLMNKGVAPMKK